MPVLYIRIVLDSFYLLIFYSEKFSTWIWRLPFGVNVNLYLSNKGQRKASTYFLWIVNFMNDLQNIWAFIWYLYCTLKWNSIMYK